MQSWGARRGRPAARRVPALDRFRILQGIRGAAVVLVLLCVVLAPGTLEPWPRSLVPLTAGLTLAAAAAGVVVHLRPGRVLLVLRAMLVVDAAYITVGTYLTGGESSPLRYAVLLHLAAVTLLASARTGVTLAGLDSVLLVGLRCGAVLGWWPETSPSAGGPATQQLVVFLVALWIVAGTSALLAVVQHRELRRRAKDLEALSLLTERVERAARPAAVAQLLLDAVVSSYSLRRGVVLLVEGDDLALLASSSLATERPREGTSPAVVRAHEAQETLLVDVDEQEPWFSQLLPGASSVLVVPLMADSRPLGAMVVEAGGSMRHQQRLVRGLERSAAYGALALRNASLLESVQRLAATDGLTRIANRRTFESALERELSRATRAAEHVSLVMVDIDHFKDLNDALGHQGGDEVLRLTAAALAEQCREFDTAARYGGEEFAVILPGCGPDQAHEIAERLRRAVCTAPNTVRVTASAGVATFPAHAGDAESLVRAADEALYASKRAGRDRTSVSIGIPPEEQVNALIRRAVRERLRVRDAEALDDPAALGAFDY
jgi:diguanylate cyclase (GGDEF)-like protein